jgi:25S rRNA (uracil2843-N3)-methyltransferase
MAPKKAINTRKTPQGSKSVQLPQQKAVSRTTGACASQQQILNVFRHAYPDAFGPGLLESLQEIKKHLYDRDFTTAFSDPELLKAYSLRWSPSRALAYSCILEEYGISDQIKANSEEPFKVVCLGGGAGAELVAFGASLGHSKQASDIVTRSKRELNLCLVDMACWNNVLQQLFMSMLTPPPVSKYAAAHVKETNPAFIYKEVLDYSFTQQDVLDMDSTQIKSLVGDSKLVTILFTLNELYAVSVSKANAFLLRLREHIPSGGQLLVVDSAGSYSEVTLNSNTKKYPMQWLLDYTVLENGKRESTPNSVEWTKIQGHEGVWFRLPEGLKYPLELENMRYQIHLYKRENPPS